MRKAQKRKKEIAHSFLIKEALDNISSQIENNEKLIHLQQEMIEIQKMINAVKKVKTNKSV